MTHDELWEMVPAAWRSAELCAATRALDVAAISARPIAPGEPQLIFRALTFFPPEDTRAVILGQDPYAQPGKANGLAFGVQPDYKSSTVRDSLYNIRLAVLRCGQGDLRDTTLESWARQGVLMLNSALTTAEGWPGAHLGRTVGWDRVVGAILAHVRDCAPEAIWMLWGAAAKKIVMTMPGAADGNFPRNLRISSHPSPMAAEQGFGGHPAFLSARMFRTDDGIVWGSINE